MKPGPNCRMGFLKNKKNKNNIFIIAYGSLACCNVSPKIHADGQIPNPIVALMNSQLVGTNICIDIWKVLSNRLSVLSTKRHPIIT